MTLGKAQERIQFRIHVTVQARVQRNKGQATGPQTDPSKEAATNVRFRAAAPAICQLASPGRRLSPVSARPASGTSQWPRCCPPPLQPSLPVPRGVRQDCRGGQRQQRPQACRWSSAPRVESSAVPPCSHHRQKHLLRRRPSRWVAYNSRAVCTAIDGPRQRVAHRASPKATFSNGRTRARRRPCTSQRPMATRKSQHSARSVGPWQRLQE
mmetsp:Transcript_154005/g.493698  ORF Transcript_154005/g.493698 Transcript_154005/m.493698 type:complete len:211 (-) Transcript_154005:924-1556(-)